MTEQENDSNYEGNEEIESLESEDELAEETVDELFAELRVIRDERNILEQELKYWNEDPVVEEGLGAFEVITMEEVNTRVREELVQLTAKESRVKDLIATKLREQQEAQNSLSNDEDSQEDQEDKDSESSDSSIGDMQVASIEDIEEELKWVQGEILLLAQEENDFLKEIVQTSAYPRRFSDERVQEIKQEIEDKRANMRRWKRKEAKIVDLWEHIAWTKEQLAHERESERKGGEDK